MLKEYQDKIGKVKKFNLNGLKVECEILDVRKAFGHIDYLITPVAGEGEKWIRK